jgi:hypothetical protein
MQQVLLGLSKGVPLSVVCRSNKVHRSTIHEWRAKDEAFAQAYDVARALGFDHIAVECLEIIDDKSEDVILDSEGVPHFNTAAVLRAKARVDTRLKLLACWDSGRYGPAKTLKVEGEVKQTTRHVLDPRLMDETGREALRALLAQAQAQGLIEGPEPATDAEFEEVGLGRGLISAGPESG